MSNLNITEFSSDRQINDAEIECSVFFSIVSIHSKINCITKLKKSKHRKIPLCLYIPLCKYIYMR